MPKLESPFVRALNDKREYLVTPEITPGYEWVFTDDDVLAVEKLNGTNVSIFIEDGIVKSIWNRSERVPFFNKGKEHIVHGLLSSYAKGYLEFLSDGQHFGELIGEKIDGNPYGIKGNLWIPFKLLQTKYSYNSWGKYPKTFEAISEWFEKDIFSLYIKMTQNGKTEFPEGIVFTKKSTGQMAKLRRDMFSWYSGTRHKE